ncbi:MAG: prolyl oligopeptidase family serine peptidase [Candidatus Riflebacteria bacterium]|nr:prolyl oligopeptidase family serine peptidase [Candidatus Riflebacteria bacterium]
MGPKIILVFLFFCMLNAIPAVGAERIQTGFLDRTVSVKNTSYKYQVYLPIDYQPHRKFPVILFLHGAGERGTDGLLQTQVGLGAAIRQHRDRFPFITIFPQVHENNYWSGPFIEEALKALEQTLREFNCDRRHIYLTGMSMGGLGTWAVAARSPRKFAALVPICSWVKAKKPKLSDEDVEKNFKFNPFAKLNDPYNGLSELIKGIPVWIFHGNADDVVSVEESRKMYDILKKNGFDVKYTEYEGVNHNAWDKAYSEPELVNWLLSKELSR